MYKNLRLELIKSVEKLDKKGILEIEHFEQLNSVLKEALQNHVNSLYEDLDIMRKEKPQEKLIEDEEEFKQYNILEKENNQLDDVKYFSKGDLNRNYKFDSESLKKFMMINNIKKEEFSQKIGCKSTTLYNWISGKYNPNKKNIIKISKIIKQNPKNLIIEKNEKESKITQLRKERGLSQKDLARLIEVSVTRITDIERKRVKPSKRELKEFARILKVNSYELV